MSSPYEKFIGALNLAMHPNTVDADIVAGIRGAYRLLGGKTLKQFLGLSDGQIELAEKLATAEAKLDGAVEYCNELKLEVQRLQEELAKPRGKHKVLSGGDIAWLGFSATIIIGGLVTLLCFAQPPANYAVAADKPTLTSRPGWINEQGQPCREYTKKPSAGSVEYATACRRADGLWQFLPPDSVPKPATASASSEPKPASAQTQPTQTQPAEQEQEWDRNQRLKWVSMVWGYDTSQEHIPEWFCENGLATPELRQKCLDHNMKATVTYTSRPGWTNDHGQPCREYTTRPQGSVVLEYGVACRGTDGLWRIVP